MTFQNETHKRICGAERTKLRKSDNWALAALYLMTAEHSLWISAKHHIGKDGKVDLQKRPPWKHLYEWVCPVECGQGSADRRKAELPV